MSSKYNGLGAHLQRVIDLGLIDSWMRGMARIVPHTGADTTEEFNTHMLYVDAHGGIGAKDITAMVGFRQLIAACSQHDICVSMAALPDGHLKVSFEPELCFSRSRIFGASYTNVLPALFGKQDGLKTKP